jgi:hypothetical protein
MKMPFRLRKTSCHPADALLVPPSAGDLLRLCAALGGAWPAVHAVPGGFVVKLARPLEAAVPGAVRLRALGPDLLVPADGELEPALLPDEAQALGRDGGLVFLPGGRVLGYAPARRVRPGDVLAARRAPRRAWRALPRPAPLADRLHEVVRDGAPDGIEQILEEGAGDIGAEAPRPPESSPPAAATGAALSGLGRGLVWLGERLRWRGLARLGARLVQEAVRRAPRVTEALLGAQEAALRELLRRFRAGDVEAALRRALPLAGQGRRGESVAGDANLPRHDLRYRLADLLDAGRGAPRWWLGGRDVRAELEAEYHKAAQAAVQVGDYRRAAFIYGRLLGEHRLAADVLARAGLHHDAALLYLEKVGDPLAAARAFEAAGEMDRALALYRERGEHALAGDLLKRAGEADRALVEYRCAAEQYSSAGNHLAAAELLRVRARRTDLAIAYLRAGWQRRPGGTAQKCLLTLLTVLAERAPGELPALVDNADAFYRQYGHEAQAAAFYNDLARLAERPGLAALREELRDRALMGLAEKLRQRASEEERPGGAVSSLFGASGAWSAAQVRDAEVAYRAALRRPAVSSGKRVVRVRTLHGEVTAACAAAQTGQLFLGFASGAVACFQPRTGTWFTLPPYPWPVVSLATDPAGCSLVVLRQSAEEEAGDLIGFAIEGAFHAGAWRTLPLPGDGWLTPVCPSGGSGVVGLWDGSRLAILHGPDLIPITQFAPPEGAEGSRGGAILAAPSPRLAWFYTVLLAGDGLWSRRGPDEPPVCPTAAKGVEFVRTALGWQPAGPEGSTLSRPAVSWLALQPGQFEMAGVTATGTLCWSSFRLFPRAPAALVHNRSTAPTVFRAAALVRPGQVAGVERAGVHWLRATEALLAPRAVTEALLPDAVACFASPLTGEVLVACAGGDVVRVPVPA